MVTLFYLFFTNSLNIAFFILLMLLVEPFLKKHFSAVCLYRVWVVLLIGLLIPMRFDFTKTLFYISSPRISVEDKGFYEFEVSRFHETNTAEKVYLSQNHSDAITWNDNPNNVRETILYFLKKSLSEKNSFIIRNRFLFLCLFWLTGVILLLAIKGIRYYRYIKQLKRFISPLNKENDLQEEFNQCIKELYNKDNKYFNVSLSSYDKTTICNCPIITSPMTIGFLKPVILLPNESYTKKDLHFILQHELVHIRRRDSLVKLILFIVQSLNWYNPLCYLLSRHLNNWCESSCDEIVLYKSSKTDCLDYGKLLLKCSASKPNKNITFIMNLYGGKNNMKHRLVSIMDRRKKHSGKLFLLIVLGIISTTAIVTIGNHKNVLASNNNDTVTADGAVVLDGISNGNSKDTGTATQDNKDSERIVSETTKEVSQDTESEDIFKDTALEDVSDADVQRETVVEYAKQAEGTPYEWGGNYLNIGVDSSGYVQAIYKKLSYDLPRKSSDQATACEKVSMDNLLPGDLIFYTGSDDNIINHVSIYIGNNQVIHAKNARDNVTIQDINYRPPYSAGRIISD